MPPISKKNIYFSNYFSKNCLLSNLSFFLLFLWLYGVSKWVTQLNSTHNQMSLGFNELWVDGLIG